MSPPLPLTRCCHSSPAATHHTRVSESKTTSAKQLPSPQLLGRRRPVVAHSLQAPTARLLEVMQGLPAYQPRSSPIHRRCPGATSVQRPQSAWGGEGAAVG